MATPMMASTTITTAAQNSGVSGMKIIRMATCSFERLVVTLVRQRLDKRLCELVGGAPVQRLVDHQPEPREVLAGGAAQYAPGLQRRAVLRALTLFPARLDVVFGGGWAGRGPSRAGTAVPSPAGGPARAPPPRLSCTAKRALPGGAAPPPRRATLGESLPKRASAPPPLLRSPPAARRG